MYVFEIDPNAKSRIVWAGEDAPGDTEWSHERHKHRIVEITHGDGRVSLHVESCNLVDAMGNEIWHESRTIPSALFMRCVLGNDKGNRVP